jgi:hypothetical protein
MLSPDQLFQFFNTLVLPGWILLLFFPRWSWTTRFVTPILIPGLFALGYLGLFVSQLGNVDGGFGSLGDVESLFTNRYVLLAGWLHYLAFDLFIGAWEVRDSQRIQLAHWFVIPCLLATFMLGPIGLLLYFVMRTIKTRRLLLVPFDETERTPSSSN